MKFFSGFLLGGVVCGLAVAYALWSTWPTSPCATIKAGFEQEKAGLYSTLAYQQGLVDRAERRETKAYAKVGEVRAEMAELYDAYAWLAAKNVDLSIPTKTVKAEPTVFKNSAQGIEEMTAKFLGVNIPWADYKASIKVHAPEVLLKALSKGK